MTKNRDRKSTHWNESSYLISYPKGVFDYLNAFPYLNQYFISFRYENNQVHFVSLSCQPLLYARYYDAEGNAYQLPDLKDANYDHFIFTPDYGYYQILHATILSYGIIKEVEWRIPNHFQYPGQNEPRIVAVPQGVFDVVMLSSVTYNLLEKSRAARVTLNLPSLPVIGEEVECSASVCSSPSVDGVASEENGSETVSVAEEISVVPTVGIISPTVQQEENTKDSISSIALAEPSVSPVIEAREAVPVAPIVVSGLSSEVKNRSWANVTAQKLPTPSAKAASTLPARSALSSTIDSAPALSQLKPKSRSRQTAKAEVSPPSRSVSRPADQWTVVGAGNSAQVFDFPTADPIKPGSSWADRVKGNTMPPQQEAAKAVILPAIDHEATKDGQPSIEVKPSTNVKPKKAKKPAKVPAKHKPEDDIDSVLAEFGSPSLSQQDLIALLTTPERFIKKLRENIKSLKLEDVVALHGKISDLPDKERAEAAALLIKQREALREPKVKSSTQKRSKKREGEIIFPLTPEQAQAIVKDTASTEQTLKENCHTVEEWQMVYLPAYLNKRLDLVDAIRQQLRANPIEMSTLAVHIFPLIAAEVNDYDYLMEVLGRLGEKNMFKAQTYRTNPGEENQLVHSFLTDYLHLTKTLNLDIMKFFAVRAKDINFSAAHPVNPYFYMHNDLPMLMSAMEICVAREFCEGIKYLHQELGVSILTTTIEWSLVCFAAVSNKLESLKTLCQLGANIDDLVEGVTLLDIVLSRASNFLESTNYLEMLEYLVYQTALTTQIGFEYREIARVNLMRLNITTQDLATRLPSLMNEIARRSPDGGMQYELFAAERATSSSSIEEGGAFTLHCASFDTPADALRAFDHLKRVVSKSEDSKTKSR